MPLALVVLLLLSLGCVVFALGVLLRAWLYRPVRPLLLTVIERHTIDDQLFQLRLARTGWRRCLPLPRYRAGQSVGLQFADHPLTRRYSLARWYAWPWHYELTIRRESHGRLSTRLYQHAQVGQTLWVKRPAGHFVWPVPAHQHTQRVVLVAGGVGITPLLAMLDQWQHDAKPHHQVHLYWQVRDEQEWMYRQALDELCRHTPLQVHLLASRPHLPDTPAQRLSVERLLTDLGQLDDVHFVFCTGNALLEAMTTGLQAAGVPDTQIHFERFALAHQDTGGPWQVQVDQQTIVFDQHASLLDALEHHAIPIAADCRTGSCGQCRVRLLSGEGMDRVRPECNVGQHERLACCLIPTSDLHISLRSTSV